MRRPAVSEKKGGRKPASIAQPELVPAVEALIEQDTAGSPVEAGIRWTNRPVAGLAAELQSQGFSIGVDALRRILFDELGLSRRQAFKDEAACCYEHRDAQFRYLAHLRAEYARHAWPVLSIDTKKKELLGNLYHPGPRSPMAACGCRTTISSPLKSVSCLTVCTTRWSTRASCI